MKYICLVYQDERKMNEISEAEFTAIVSGCGAWVGDLEKNGQHVFSSGLQSVRTAATLRDVNGKVTVTDGPFAETKEYFAGFTILEARDLNEALSMASKLPAVHLGSVEVRPLMSLDVEVSDPLDQKCAAAIRRSIAAE